MTRKLLIPKNKRTEIQVVISKEDNEDLKILAKIGGVAKTSIVRLAISNLLYKNREIIKADKKLEKEKAQTEKKIKEEKTRLLKEIKGEN